MKAISRGFFVYFFPCVLGGRDVLRGSSPPPLCQMRFGLFVHASRVTREKTAVKLTKVGNKNLKGIFYWFGLI